jgi:DNA segregation ATPase FtsK/SpoIIIE-like protein
MIQPIIIMLLITTIAIVVIVIINGILRSRKIFGIIPLTELNRHLVVLGPTGSGKTTVAKAIIAKVLADSPKTSLIIIDWKGEYTLANATVIRKIPNVWNVPGDSPREKALMATEMIREMGKDVVEITPASSLLLLKVLEEEYKKGIPTTEKIISILEKYATMAQREYRHAEANMYLALIRRLYLLTIDEERPAKNEEGDPQLVVYDLGGLPSVYLKTLYSNYVLMTIYRESISKAMAKANALKMLLVAEESQNYIHRRGPEPPSLAERLIYELRSFGVGVVLVCPDPELLPSSILKDVGTIVSTSPDTIPRFALERYLFRASLEEAEDTLKKLKRAKMIIYHNQRLYFLRRLPKPKLKPKARPKGDRMGVTDQGAGSLRAWPILPHRSPGRPAPRVVEVAKEPKAIEVTKEKSEAEKPKVIEVITEPTTESKTKAEAVEKLRLEPEEEELEEESVEVKEPESAGEPIEERTKPVAGVEEAKLAEKEEAEIIEEEVPMTVEPEPAPEGPPIPSSLPYRGSLCPAGRSATLGRVLF